MNAVMETREPSAEYLGAVRPALVKHFELIGTAPDGVARLREFILDLAVRGKLVPQDPGDESASELLKKIRTEKDRRVSEAKAKRDKPLAELTAEDQPFAIPRKWCWVRLGEITNYGSPVKAGTLLPDTWVLDMEDIEKFSGRLIQRLRFSARPAVSDKNCFTKGDVLYAKLRPYLNKVLVADDDGVCTTEIIPFRCYGEYEPGYFRLALSSPYFLDYVNARSYGMKMPRLGTDDARNAALPLPPLAEQSRIVTRVEELMRLCDALEAKNQLEAAQHAQLVQTLLGALTVSTSPEELAENWQRVAAHFDLLLDRPEAIDALEQTILQLAVRGLLVHQEATDETASTLLQRIRVEKDRLHSAGRRRFGMPLAVVAEDEKPYELPTSWEWARFGQVADIASNLVQPSQHVQKWQVAPDCIEKGTGRLLQRRTVAQAEIISPNHLFKPGQILYSKIRPSLSKAVLIDFEGLCSADMYPIETRLDANFLLTYMLSQAFLEQVSIAENRVKMPKLNQEALISFLVAIPPLSEQTRIVARVATLRRLCADLRQRLAARQATQALLAEALIDEGV